MSRAAASPATRTLPYRWYTDPAVLDLERERVFRGAWHYVGRAEQVAEPRRHVAAEAGGVPVVVVRDEDGALRAFVNVCRHRGHELVRGEGMRATLQCPYHAWTYGLDGSLRSAPRSEREGGLDAESLSLVPVAVDCWGPFLFVNTDPDAPPLGEALSELPRRLSLDSLRFHERVAWEVEANWKVVVENFLECYHCAVAHPEFSRVVDVDPDAYRLELGCPVLSQYASLRDGDTGVEGSFHFVWPSTVLNAMPGPPNVSIGRIVPLAPGRTARFLDYFFGKDVSEEAVRELRTLDDHVSREDEALVESVQRGMAAGVLEHGHLLPESEQLVAAFQARVAEALGD